MGIRLGSAILLALVGTCSLVCANVALWTLVMGFVIDTAVESNRSRAD